MATAEVVSVVLGLVVVVLVVSVVAAVRTSAGVVGGGKVKAAPGAANEGGVGLAGAANGGGVASSITSCRSWTGDLLLPLASGTAIGESGGAVGEVPRVVFGAVVVVTLNARLAAATATP
jgi:hypothetical protein